MLEEERRYGAGLRLARAGVSLRYRRGDPAPWTVKLPAQVPGVRREVSRRAAPGMVPQELSALVTVWHRGAPLAPAAVVRTVRRAYELRDGAGVVLAEVAGDTVSVLDGRRTTLRFREIEVERRGCGHDLLDRVEAALRAAGAVAGEALTAVLRTDIARILNQDPLVAGAPATALGAALARVQDLLGEHREAAVAAQAWRAATRPRLTAWLP
ncbi:MAG TPA: CYTH domain-containing protein [Micromonosporaceae bacterium]|nr:CYTH domain-containing protein [Micromonosporaceae bacterium]